MKIYVVSENKDLFDIPLSIPYLSKDFFDEACNYE